METERLLLRDFRAEDEARLYEYASGREVVRSADWGPSDIWTIRTNLPRRVEEQDSWPRDSAK